MRCAVVLHAPIGGGKTRTAEAVIEGAKVDGIKVMGVLSRRHLGESSSPCYELLELDTGRRMPLVKPARAGNGDGWESYGNPRFIFSKKGFFYANQALKRAADEMRNGVVVFIDEYGKLESGHLGIYIGALLVANALRKGGIAVYLCRDDKVAEVHELVDEKAYRVFDVEAGDVDGLLRIIRGCSRL
jgi:nucleoside-triphosphatase THEP1